MDYQESPKRFQFVLESLDIIYKEEHCQMLPRTIWHEELSYLKHKNQLFISVYLFLGRKYDQPRQHIKKQRHYFVNNGLSSQGYGFSSDHVWIWELDYKESWALKNICFWTVVLEKTLESPLDCKEIQPVHPKGDQSWVFIRGTDVEAETPILWPPDVKTWLIWKDPDAGKDWGQEQKGTTEDEIVGGITDSMDMSWVNSGS